MFPHRTFLYWLLYFVTVVFGLGCLIYLQLPQIAIHYDHSHLTALLIGLYVIAEARSGREAWGISRQNRIADRIQSWLSQHTLIGTSLGRDGRLVLAAKDSTEVIPSSAINDHLVLLHRQAKTAKQNKPVGGEARSVNQDTLLDVTAERLYENNTTAEFISERIVWVGILATIIGVIMAFWPLMDGASIDTVKNNLGGFFGGIAVAFIPTAVSFVFKIVLDVNSRIINNGMSTLIDKIACVSETSVLPVLEVQ